MDLEKLKEKSGPWIYMGTVVFCLWFFYNAPIAANNDDEWIRYYVPCHMTATRDADSSTMKSWTASQKPIDNGLFIESICFDPKSMENHGKP